MKREMLVWALVIVLLFSFGCLGGGEKKTNNNATVTENKTNNTPMINYTDVNLTVENPYKEQSANETSTGYTYTPDAPLNVYFFNVGYANSVLIKKGDFDMLIDAGDPTGGNNIVSKMKDVGVDDLEVIVITHPVQKRLSGLSRVLDNFDVEELWDNDVINDYYQPLHQKVIDKGVNVMAVRAGDEFSYNGINVTMYNPYNSTFSPNNENLNSIVLKITDGAFSVLFTSDLENTELNNILSDHPNLFSTIVEVPKNGKSSIRELASTNQMIIRLIDATRPDAMIISVGPNNEDAPSQPLLNAIKTQGVPVYRTDNDGTVLISYNNGTYQIYKNK